jgi:ferredoxin
VKFHVDEALCAGHGLCLSTAPDVFDCDDDGINVAVGKSVELEPGLETAAREGAEACPEQAIRLFE